MIHGPLVVFFFFVFFFQSNDSRWSLDQFQTEAFYANEDLISKNLKEPLELGL